MERVLHMWSAAASMPIGEHAACPVVARPQLVVLVRQCARAAACPRRRQVGGESSGRKDSGEERGEMATRRITRRPHGPGSRAPPVRRRTSADKTGQAGCTAGASSQRRDPGCEGPPRGRPSRQRPCAQRSHGVAIRGRHGSRRQQARIDRDAVDLPDQHAQLACLIDRRVVGMFGERRRLAAAEGARQQRRRRSGARVACPSRHIWSFDWPRT